jgi:predicted Zn-dependent protease
MIRLVIFLLLILVKLEVKAVPILNSLPTTDKVIYLDFDGEIVLPPMFWDYNSDTAAFVNSSFNDNQILTVFNIVAEDFRPFIVNVTTSRVSYNNANPLSRIKIIVTASHTYTNSNGTTGIIYPSAGGVAAGGTFYGFSPSINEGFVFTNTLGFNPKYVAQAISHEVGHTLGLNHKARTSCDVTQSFEGYHKGFPLNNSSSTFSETSWAPIMGVSYYANNSLWAFGRVPSNVPQDCFNHQDEISIIVSGGVPSEPYITGIGFRPDDYPNSISTSLPNLIPTGSIASFIKEGIITNSSDKDVFKLTLTDAINYVNINLAPYSTGPLNANANLDAVLKIYNANGTLYGMYDPLLILNVTIGVELPAGDYYFEVSGGSNANMDLYTASGDGNIGNPSYGSIGSYTLTGAVGYVTVANGNWSNPATWLGGTVPPAGAIVYVRHQVNGDVNASCYALTVQQSTGQLTVLNGKNITVKH